MPMKGLFERKGDGLRGLETDEQGDGQSRPLRGGNGIELRGGNSGFAQCGLRDGQKIFQMFARGEFGHNAAVFGMQLNLRRNGVRQDFSVTHNRGAGLVAGSFNGKKCHS